MTWEEAQQLRRFPSSVAWVALSY